MGGIVRYASAVSFFRRHLLRRTYRTPRYQPIDTHYLDDDAGQRRKRAFESLPHAFSGVDENRHPQSRHLSFACLCPVMAERLRRQLRAGPVGKEPFSRNGPADCRTARSRLRRQQLQILRRHAQSRSPVAALFQTVRIPPFQRFRRRSARHCAVRDERSAHVGSPAYGRWEIPVLSSSRTQPLLP